MGKLSWKSLEGVDPAVQGEGYHLRYRRRKGGIFAELRIKTGPGQWRGHRVGRVPSEDELRARYPQAGITARGSAVPSTLPLNLALDPIREQARALLKTPARDTRITLRDAYELHMSSKPRSPRTVEDYQARMEQHFGDWLDRPLETLDRSAVRARHREITRDHGPYGANGALRVLRAVWNRARRQHPELAEAPTINVDWHPETRRDAAIPLAQLPQWWRDVQGLENAVRRDFYMLTLFTGLRRRSADCIRREHVALGLEGEDRCPLDRGVLLIPKPKGGAKRAFELPLSTYLVPVIRRRLEATTGPWLFPAASKSGHIEEPKANGSWRGVPFTVHGLRNTYISAATAAGVHPYHIKLLVNHAVPKADVTAGYLARDVEALREPQQRVTDWLLARLGG